MGLLDKIKNNYRRLKEEYRNQPEIVIWTPIKLSPEATLFEEQIYIIDQDRDLRTLTRIGGSTHLSVNPDWVKHFSKKMKGYFIQTHSRRGIMYLQDSGG